MELITITYEERPFGFARSVSRHCPGVRFPNGKIAFLNEGGEIRASDSEAKLKEALASVSIAPYHESSEPHEQPSA